MTLPRVESGFGNSSSSSMASFMSGLLQENFGQTDISCGQIQIAIVDDNAKVEVEEICGIHRSRSLVTMRHHRSGRQLSRWACTYQRKDSDPNLMLSARGPRKAPRGSSNTTKLLTTTSDSMLLNLPTRTVSPRLTNGKTLTSTTQSSKSRLGNATWSNADVAKSTNRVVTSPIFDLSLDISTEEQKRNLNTNPFLMDRLSTMSLIDETKSYMPMEPILDGKGSSPLQSDIPPMEAVGIRMPVRRPSVQPADHVPHDAATTSYPQQPQQQQSSKKYKDVIPANEMDMLNSVTLAGSSSLNNMTRIRDPSALGFQMPNRQNRNSGSLLLPDNSLSRNKQHTKKSSQPQSSGHSSSSGMRRISSSSKGLGPSSFEESRRGSSSKSLNSKKFLNDPSLVGLNVKLGAR